MNRPWSIARALVLGALSSQPSPAAPAEPIVFPPPRLEGTMSLEAALAHRRSERELGGTLRDAEIGQLLWAAQGVTDPASGHRTAPSAGALYPLELYAFDARGVWHYEPANHRIVRVRDGDARRALARACGQEHVGGAALDVVITAVPARTRTKYGDRAERYALLEAGHAAQNLLLQATALGLGAVPVGAFDDASIASLLAMPAGQIPLYVLSVGRR